MLILCNNLLEILGQIVESLNKGNFQLLPELLSKKKILHQKIQESVVDKKNIDEIIKLLTLSISIEKSIIELAKDKKKKIIDELNELQRQKKAFSAYNNNALKEYGHDY